MNIYQRINKVRESVKTVIKDTTVKINKNSSYSAASHDGVTELIQEPFLEAGIAVEVSMADCKFQPHDFVRWNKYDKKEEAKREYETFATVDVTFVNTEKPEDRFTVRSFGMALDSGDKGVGKAFSYAVKYAYLKVLMLKSGDEEEQRSLNDGNRPSTDVKKPTVKAHTFNVEAQEKEALINRIGSIMAPILEGMDEMTRVATLQTKLGISKSSEIKDFSTKELNEALNKLQEG